MFKKILEAIIVFPFSLFNKLIEFLSLFSTHFKKISCDYQIGYLDSLTTEVKHPINSNRFLDLSFFTPNSVCLYRAETFSDCEPETLEWIKEFGKDNAVLFDIGANIGLYSIYHSKLNNGESFAFEPSCFNLKLLTKNININNCTKLVTVISSPLSDKVGFGEFKYGSNVEGGALSSFGVNFGHDGNDIDTTVSSNVLGFTLDWLYENSILEVPTIVKIDVDGIEHIILKGAKNILSHPNCKSVLIEVNDKFYEQSDGVNFLLSSYGYQLRDKLQVESTKNSKLFSSVYNQIWVK
jgi:FkbM family methyltransferase